MRWAGWTGVAIVWVCLCSACADQGNYNLHIVVPDQEAALAMDRIILRALEPGGFTCQDIVQNGVDSSVTTVHAEHAIAYPLSGLVKFPGVPGREIVFYAEGLNGELVLLRACETENVRAGVSVEIILRLTWICHPTDEIPNGQDDDCDGLTDECISDTECDDLSPCTHDLCVEGICHLSSLPDGVSCDDGLEDVHPGGLEGPAGDPSCSDGLDNDCDGKFDWLDADCAGSDQICSLDHWCWENPWPEGTSHRDIWGFAPDDIWIVGSKGIILHWNGNGLTFVPSGMQDDLIRIWGSSPSDIWILTGGNDFLHFDGTGFSLVPGGAPRTLRDLHGSATDDVWAVGWNGAGIRYNGDGWSQVPKNTSMGLNAVWVAGASGTILHRAP